MTVLAGPGKGSLAAHDASDGSKRMDGVVTSPSVPIQAEDAPSKKTSRPWAHFVAGGIGGMTSATLTSPLDVLKTRLQSDFYRSKLSATTSASRVSYLRGGLAHFRETFEILASIRRLEGWQALFRGLGPNLTGVVPARAINFYTYGNGKRILADRLNYGVETSWIHLMAAVAAGVATGTVTNPIWLVKTRMQLDKVTAERGGPFTQRQYAGSLDCIRQTVRGEGVRGLYRGLTASYLGISESALQWVFYEQMKTYLRQREHDLVASRRERTTWDTGVAWFGKVGAAGTAKFFAALVTYPHEVIRTRLRQAPQMDGRMKYTGIVQCFRMILREEGLASLYGGLTPHILRVVPSAAIMFGT